MKILILFAHPAFHKSKINRKLIESVTGIEDVTINNLYENYPDFFINIKKEQQLLIEHDILVWHHPFYWYSCPAILKEWIDLVLEHNFAYGTKGKALEGKKAITIISTGGSKDVYSKEGSNHYTINQFLAPFHQTANLCRMEYLPPYVIHGSHKITESELKKSTLNYKNLILALRDNRLPGNYLDKENSYINDILV